MSAIKDIVNPWRTILLSQMASFRGFVFHVDNFGLTSGRRTVVHSYPKRNEPYAEDMGRHSRRVQFSGYLIYRPSNPNYNYVEQRQLLYKALEQDDSGFLVHPVFCPEGWLVMCERFTMTETRERGGYTQFDMAFVDAGKPVRSEGVINTAGDVAVKAAAAEVAAAEVTVNASNLG